MAYYNSLKDEIEEQLKEIDQEYTIILKEQN